MALSKSEIRALKELRSLLEMNRAHFGGIGKEADQFTEKVKKETLCWRQSWIFPIIDALLEPKPRRWDTKRYLEEI